MLIGRVSENVYVLTSELYAQVTAGLIATHDGAVLIDSMPFPSESRELAALAARVCPAGARYLILTHYHADHSNGAYLFPQAEAVAHARYRELMTKFGIPALEIAKAEEPELAEVAPRMPDITFDEGELALQVGRRLIRLIHAPGHTQDLIMAYLEEEKTLFASDAVVPVPSIVDGDAEALRTSLKQVASLSVENLVQGHGEIILRGEVQDVVKASLAYLDKIESKVAKAVKSGKDKEALRQITIESCGLSRIPLNGLVQQIHLANLMAIYDRTAKQR